MERNTVCSDVERSENCIHYDVERSISTIGPPRSSRGKFSSHDNMTGVGSSFPKFLCLTKTKSSPSFVL